MKASRIAPILLMLALYWRGLFAWFQKDDFAWLSLDSQVHSARDLGWALFAPLAQGTIRTLSERLEFLSFPALFGLRAFPFHLLAFATCAATIVLLNIVASKLTGSPAAGFLAAILWTMNSALALPMTWASVYNEIAWPFALLLAFWLLLRYVETGETRFLRAQCIVFVLGLFVLETNVVYPAIAAAYALFSPEATCRGLFRKLAPLFAISAVYTAIHIYLAPLPTSGPYLLHWDSKIFQTLTTYWGWALGPGQGRLIEIKSTLIRASSVWAITAGLAAFLIAQVRRKTLEHGSAVLLFPVWFVITLGPLLPLRDHITLEYLTAPALGLAIWAGWAMAAAWRANVFGKIAAAALFLTYAGFSIPIGQVRVRGFADASHRLETFVEAVIRIARASPGKTILLEGVNAEQFYDAVFNHAFDLYSIHPYLVPENRAGITADPYFRDTSEFFSNPGVVQRALKKNLAVVIDVSNGTARDATADYAKDKNANEIASRIDLGSDLFEDQLGAGWYTNDGGFRWMGKRATLTIAGPARDGERLYVRGFAPGAALQSGPLNIQFSIGGVAMPQVRVTKAEAGFAYDFPMPASTVGLPKVEIAIEVDRTFRLSGDPRTFGIVFVSFEVR